MDLRHHNLSCLGVDHVEVFLQSLVEQGFVCFHHRVEPLVGLGLGCDRSDYLPVADHDAAGGNLL